MMHRRRLGAVSGSGIRRRLRRRRRRRFRRRRRLLGAVSDTNLLAVTNAPTVSNSLARIRCYHCLHRGFFWN